MSRENKIAEIVREFKQVKNPCWQKKAEIHGKLQEFHQEDLINFIINQDQELIELSKNLIKAIDENCFEGQDRERENDTDLFITQRFIADELEELRGALK